MIDTPLKQINGIPLPTLQGGPGGRLTDEDWQLVRAYFAEHPDPLNYSTLAEALGVHLQTIKQHAAAEGWQAAREEHLAMRDQVAATRTALEQGLDLAELDGRHLRLLELVGDALENEARGIIRRQVLKSEAVSADELQKLAKAAHSLVETERKITQRDVQRREVTTKNEDTSVTSAESIATKMATYQPDDADERAPEEQQHADPPGGGEGGAPVARA